MIENSIEMWPIINDILRREGVARQHLNSYNEFMERGLQSIIDEVGEIEVETAEYPYKIKLGKVKLQQPRIMELDGSITHVAPMEARLRNLTYASPVMLECSVVEDGKILESRFIHIGDMPVMVKSNTCILHNLPESKLVEFGEDPRDPGGYFIINGSERVIVGLEDLSYNKIIVDEEATGTLLYKAKVYSSIVGYRAKLELIMKPDGSIVTKIPGSPVDIPLITLIRALGLESDKDIADSVSLNEIIQDELEPSFEKSGEVSTSRDAIVYISKRIAPGMLEEFQIKRAETLLDWGLLPHIGKNPENRHEKALFLGEAACKLTELKLGWIEADDKDHYGNKVIKFAGQMLADLFRTAFRNLIRDMKYQLERSGQKRGINAVAAAVRPGIVSDKLNNAIATGNWGRGRVGVTQLLDRTNYMSTISHLRRIQSPLSRSQPNFEARDLHATHFGRICPAETPEGSNCGLVKNLALSAIISVHVLSAEVTEKLYEIGVQNVDEASEKLRADGTRVFVDGRLIGYIEKGEHLAETLRTMRRSGKIHPHVGVYLYSSQNSNATKRLYVSCNAGRVMRPLVVLKSGRPLITSEVIEKVSKKFLSWMDLLYMGVVELVDANEEENCYVAIDPKKIDLEKHTHLEIFPSAILGVGASIIPYPEHNQSPRNTYESAMAKQSLGFSTPLMNASTYVRQHFMLYPQIPVVSTKAINLLGLEDRPTGQNCVVAVLPFEGYNIEDAVVFNRSAVDRGLGRTFFYRIYEAEAKQYPGGMKDNFEIPKADVNIRGYRGEKAYRLLEADGAIMHEAVVNGGDILIGRTSPPRFMEEYKEFEVKGPYRRDTSVGVRPSENGVVDTVMITQSVEGGKMYKIRVRDMRIPEIGDKFASRHGQKGVVGMLVNQEDLPYTEDGVVPDVMINPHAFPSRMTVGQFMESLGGKAASLRGKIIDGSAFLGEKMDDFKAAMEQYGFKYTGKEAMYDGRTGRKFPADVYVGVVYYQKLHHMVADKIHSRARGQVQMLTKQPTEGRARGGGLRFGEMERDCLIAYGASMMLKDRLLEESDKAEIHVCEICGLLAYYDVKQRRYVCRVCGEKAKISPVVIAYAFKLLLQEMMSLNVGPRLLPKEKV